MTFAPKLINMVKNFLKNKKTFY